MAPPELTADAPVADVLQPARVSVLPAFGIEADFAVAPCLEGLVRKRAHLDEPLLAHVRLNGSMASVAVAYFMLIFFAFNEIALFLKYLGHLHPGLFGRKSAELFGTDIIERSVRIEDVKRLQIVALAALPVVGIVRRSNLHHTGTELDSNETVCDDGDLAVRKRQLEHLAHKVLVALVIGVHGNSLVSEHGLRPCGGHGDVSAAVGERVSYIKEMSHVFLMLDFIICKCGAAVRAVVHEIQALVDQSALVQGDKRLTHGLGQAFIHGEALPGPVA